MSFFRIFKNTTEDTGHVGQAGHDSDRTWTRFVDKYRADCILVLTTKYPQWATDAEDAFMRATEAIHRNPNVTNRKPNASFRTVLCNLCIKELHRLHNPHREKAVTTFCKRLAGALQPDRLPQDTARRERIMEIIRFIRDDLLDANYENGRCFRFLKPDDLALWRRLQLSGENDSELARQLGRKVWEVNRAKRNVDRWIVEEAGKIARQLRLLD